jgi:glycosyltransferase involved in cell wall biosynthesis
MLFRGIDAYTTHSHKDMDEITRTYKLDRDKGFVVTHGSYDHFRRQPSTQHEPTDPFTILYLGLIRPYKGVEYLIQAFDTLPTEVAQQVRLIIVGETWEGHNLPAQLIAGSRYRSRIEFVNRYVTDEEVDSFFSKADVACFPYLRASQSGAAHIAMNYGIPIIASKVGGLGESLSEYDGTLFCEPASVQQLRDTLIKAIGTRERGFRDPFSWERSAQEYQGVFQSLPLASQPTSPYTWKPRIGRS